MTTAPERIPDAPRTHHQRGQYPDRSHHRGGRACGSYTVDLGGNTSTVLTIRADEDESLADNQTKTATLTIVDAAARLYRRR